MLRPAISHGVAGDDEDENEQEEDKEIVLAGPDIWGRAGT